MIRKRRRTSGGAFESIDHSMIVDCGRSSLKSHTRRISTSPTNSTLPPFAGPVRRLIGTLGAPNYRSYEASRGANSLLRFEDAKASNIGPVNCTASSRFMRPRPDSGRQERGIH